MKKPARYARLGRLIRYRKNDLIEWVDGNLRNSTSETDGAIGAGARGNSRPRGQLRAG